MKKEFHTNNSNSLLVIKRGWLPFIYRGKTEIGRRLAAALFMAAMGFGSAFFASAGFADQTSVDTINAEADQTAVISMDSGLTPAVQITKESGTDTEILNTPGTLNLNGGTVSQNITGTQAVNLGTGTDRNFNFSWGTNGGTINTGADNSLDINVDHSTSGLTKTGEGTLTLSGTGTQAFNGLNVNEGTVNLTGAATVADDATLKTGSITNLNGGATFNGNLTADGTLGVTGNLTANGTDKTATIGGATTVSGTTTANNLTVNENASLTSGGNLTANGAATLANGSSLTVNSGAATFGNTTSMTNATLTAANATFKGTATLSGNNTVTGNATFNEDQTINSGSGLNVTGTTTFDKTLTNSGTLTSGDKLTATGAATLAAGSTTTTAKNGAEFKDDLTANGTLGVTGNLAVDKTATIGGTTTVSGTTTANNLTVNDNGTFDSAGATTVAGVTTLNGTSTITNALNADGTLNVNGAATVGSLGQDVKGATTLANGSSLTVKAGAATFGSTTSMTNATLTAANATFKGTATLSGANTVTGNATFNEDQTIGSTDSLNVTGTTTFDKTLTNSGTLTSDGALTATGAATLNTGSTTNAKAGATFKDNLDSNGTLNVTGNLTANEAGKTANIGGNTSATGTSDFNNLNVNNGASLTSGDKLTATGAATLAAGSTTTTAKNGAEFKDDLTANGTLGVTGNLAVDKTATIGGTTTVSGTTTANNLTVNNNGTLDSAGATTVAGATTLNGTSTITNALNADGTLNVNGAATVGSLGQDVKGAATLANGSSLTVKAGAATFGNTTSMTNATLTAANATFKGTATLSGANTVTGNATFNEDQTIGSTDSLNVTGTTTFDKTLTNSGTLTSNGALTATGAATLNSGSTTTVNNGGATFKDNLGSNGTLGVTGNLAVDKNATIGGTTTVSGTTTANNLTVNGGTLNSASATTVTEATTLNGTSTITNALNANGALNVDGAATVGSLGQDVKGAATLADGASLTVNSGDATFGSTTSMTNATLTAANATFKGTATLSGSNTVTGNAKFNEDQTINSGSGLNVTGTTTFDKTLTNSGTLTSDGALTATGAATLNTGSTTNAKAGATFKDNLDSNGTLNVTGNLTANEADKTATFGNGTDAAATTVTGTSDFNNLNVNNGASLTSGDKLTATGAATLNNGSTTTANNGATFKDNLDSNGTLGVTGNLAVDKNATIGGTTTVSGTTTANNLTVNGGTLNSASATTVTEATTLNGTSTITNALNANGTLNVNGTATVGSLGQDVKGATTLADGSSLTVNSGAATFGNTTSMTNATLTAANATFKGTATLSGSNTVTGNAKFNEDQTIGSTDSLNVTGTTTFDKTLTNSGTLTSDGALTATGAATLNNGSTTTAKNGATFKDNLNSNGTFDVTGNLIANEAGKTANIGGNTSATGTSDFNNLNVNNGASLTSGDKLTANDAATLNAGSTTTAKNGAEFKSTLDNSGSLTVNDDKLTVTDDATLAAGSTTTANNGAEFKKNLTAGGTLNVQNGLNASGVDSTANFQAGSTTTVTDGATFAGQLDNSGSVEVTTGDLAVTNADKTAQLKSGSTTDVKAGSATFNSSVQMNGANLTTANGATFEKLVTFADGTANTITTTGAGGKTTFKEGQSFTDQTILTLTGPGATDFMETGTFTNSTLTVNNGTVTFDKTMGFVGDVKFNSAGAGTIVFADNEFLLFDSNNSINTITAMTDMKFSGDETKLANDIHFEEKTLYCHSDIAPSIFNERVCIDSKNTLLSNNIFNKDTFLNSIEKPYITYYDKDNKDIDHIVEGGVVKSYYPSEAFLLGKNTFNDNVTFSGKHEILLFDENNKLTLDNEKAVSYIARSLNVTFRGDTVFSNSTPMIDENGKQLYHNPEYDPNYSLSDGDEGYDSNKTIQYITEASTNGTDNKNAYQASEVVFDSVYATNYNYEDYTIGSLTFVENTQVEVKNYSFLDLNATYTYDGNNKSGDSSNFAVNIDVDSSSDVTLWTNLVDKADLPDVFSTGTRDEQKRDSRIDASPENLNTTPSIPVFSYVDHTKHAIDNNHYYTYVNNLSGDGTVWKDGFGILKLNNSDNKKDNYDNNNTSLKVWGGTVVIGANQLYKGDAITVYEQWYNDEKVISYKDFEGNDSTVKGLARWEQGILGFEAGSTLDVKTLTVNPGGAQYVQYQEPETNVVMTREFETGGQLWFDYTKSYRGATVATIKADTFNISDSAYIYYEGLYKDGGNGNINGTIEITSSKIQNENQDVEDAIGFLKEVFDKPLAEVSVSQDDNKYTVSVTAKSAQSFTNTVDYNDSEKAVALDWDVYRAYDTCPSNVSEDAFRKKNDILNGIWNEQDIRIVRQHLKNLGRGGGWENASTMTQHYGTAGSNFWSGTFGDASSGITTRGQSKDAQNKNSLRGGCGLGSLFDGWTVWGGPSYTSIDAKGHGGKDGYNVDRAGFLTGLRRQFDDTTSGGFLFAYSSPELNQSGSFKNNGAQSEWDKYSYHSSIEMSDYQIAMHLEHVFNEKYEASFFLGTGSQFLDWNRNVFDSSFGQSNLFTGTTKGNTLTFTAYLARPIEISKHFVLRPTIGLDSEHSWIYAFDESGVDGAQDSIADSFNQRYGYGKVQYSRNMARVGLVAGLTNADQRMGMSGRIFYGVALGGDDEASLMQQELNSGMEREVFGLAIGNDSWNLGYGLYYYLNAAKTLSMSADYNAIMYQHATTQNVTAGVQYKF